MLPEERTLHFTFFFLTDSFCIFCPVFCYFPSEFQVDRRATSQAPWRAAYSGTFSAPSDCGVWLSEALSVGILTLSFQPFPSRTPMQVTVTWGFSLRTRLSMVLHSNLGLFHTLESEPSFFNNKSRTLG